MGNRWMNTSETSRYSSSKSEGEKETEGEPPSTPVQEINQQAASSRRRPSPFLLYSEQNSRTGIGRVPRGVAYARRICESARCEMWGIAGN